MSAPSPDQFRGWLFARVIEQAAFEEVPRDKAMNTIKSLVRSCYQDGEFNSEPLVSCFRMDYGISDADLEAFALRLQEEGKCVGISVRLPSEAPPKVSFAPNHDPELPVRAEPPVAQAQAAAVGAPNPPPQNAASHLAAAAKAAKAAANSKNGAKPIARIKPAPAPAPAPPAFNPLESINDYKFLEKCVLEYADNGGKELPDLVGKAIAKLLQISDAEQSLIKREAPEPGADSDSLAAWVLRLNGLALGMGLAKAVVVTRVAHDQKNWHHAVRQVKNHFGKMVTQIMVRQTEVKKKEPDQAELFNSAYQRANRLHNELEKLTHDLAHPKADGQPEGEAPPKEKGGILRGLFKRG